MIGPRYRLYEILGRGATGVVHRAKDRLYGIDVAFKQVTAEPLELELLPRETGHHEATRPSFDSPTSTSGGPAAEHVELAREFSLLSSLRHPNIISVLDYGFDARGRPYYTMEMLDSPRDILEAGRDLDQVGRAQLVLQMLRALSYLHRRGVIHRDLKPSNVMVVEGQVKLLDFGIAQQRDRAEPQEEGARISGTILYLAPECLEGRQATETSDIYAVGLMAHELFAGKHPLAGRSVAEILAGFRTDIHVSYDLEPRLRRVLRRMLVRDPELRHHQAAEAAQDLEAALGLPKSEGREHRDSFLQAAKFVGRKPELYTLSRRLREALKGLGNVVLIGGESGVGKSRLLDELRTLALVQGAAVTGGGATPESMPLMLWYRVIRWLVMAAGLTDEKQAAQLIDVVPGLWDLLAEQFPGSLGTQDLRRTSDSYPILPKV
ncbi:MAG: serine/threonine-protein kinase, partial [Thermoanaerobaculia bacterium]|nr:serine/threonine-protein kinase [Thermoanaerobaculia bacterium]